MIKLIFADDDAIVQRGFEMIISTVEDFQLVAIASDGAEAAELCRIHKPDVAVLDIRMPGTNGISAAKTILKEATALPLLLTTFDEPKYINEALEIGAKGYILKNSPSRQIISAIRTVALGGTVFAPDIIDYIRSVVRTPAKQQADCFATLTQREMQIVSLIAEGLSNRQIAQKLYLSEGTVRNHVSVILEKSELEHRTQIAVRYYICS
jgi:DNA-binding NarL/FixJ family response regulator